MTNQIFAKPISADKQIEKLEHEKLHVEILLKQYPDLQVFESADTNINFYSTLINKEADAIQFYDSNDSSYTHIHYAMPYKEIKIECDYCNGDLTINSTPSRFPIILYYGGDYYSGNKLLYTFSYEDFAKQSNFTQDIIGKCHIYILNFIDGLSDKKIKIEELYLSKNIKKLIPFL